MSAAEPRTSQVEPEITVIIPCYNQARFLAQAIESILAQRTLGAEILVVDDGSPDDVAGACRPYAPQVEFLSLPHGGVSAARNAAVAATRGRWVHFLDADDVVKPGMHAELLEAAGRHPDWAGVACATRFVDEDGRELGFEWTPSRPVVGFRELRAANQLSTGALLLKRQSLIDVGGFDPSLEPAEDWDCWLRIARRGGLFGVVEKPLYSNRLHRTSASRKALRMVRATHEILKRAHAPEPRPALSAPEHAAEGVAADLERALLCHSLLFLGRAVGDGDAESARDILAGLSADTDPAELDPELIAWTVAGQIDLVVGRWPPDRAELVRRCWRTLARPEVVGNLPQRGQEIVERIVCCAVNVEGQEREITSLRSECASWRAWHGSPIGAALCNAIRWSCQRAAKLLGRGEPGGAR